MSRRRKWTVSLILGVSLLLNLFQFLWATSGDKVVKMSRAEVEAQIARRHAPLVNTVDYSVVRVDTPDCLLLEMGNDLNFRRLFGEHTQRTIYFSAERD